MRYMLYLSEREVKFVPWFFFFFISYLCGICKAVLKMYLNSIKLHEAKIDVACGNGYRNVLTNMTETILDQKDYVCF